MTKKLQFTLYLISAYLAFFGILFVFAPGVFEQITRSTLHDAELTLLYGQYTLTFAYVAFRAARGKGATRERSFTILIVTAGNAVVFGYLLMAGREDFSHVGPPFVVNSVFTMLLLLFRKGKSEAPREA